MERVWFEGNVHFLPVTSVAFFLCAAGLCATAGTIADPVITISDRQPLGDISLPATVSPGLLSPQTNTAINLTYGPGLTGNAAARNAFTMAATRWSVWLQDPVTLNIDVDYLPLGAETMGLTSSACLLGGFTTIRNLVANGGDMGSLAEALLPKLPTATQFACHLPNGFAFDNNMLLTQANYLALGGSRVASSDGSVTLSSDVPWDYEPRDGITAGTYDFVGVATREIGHVLGFISELDDVDSFLSQGKTSSAIEPMPLDLFRFKTSDLGTGFNFTTARRELTPGGSQSFYYGTGSVPMSTCTFAGDGNQASNWKGNLGLGVMDPTATPGRSCGITKNDLNALDLIGWSIAPEPATVVLLVLGTLVLWRP